MGRFTSFLDIADRFLQKLARSNNRFVRGNEMLFRAILDCALARCGKGIVGLKGMTHTCISFGLHLFPILQVAIGLVAHQSIGPQLGAFPVEQLLFEWPSGAEDKCILPVMAVVDGYMPIDRLTLTSSP